MKPTSRKNSGESSILGTIILGVVVGLVVTMIALYAVGLNDNSSNEQTPQIKTINPEFMFIYIDQVTGVNYMMMYAYGGYGGVCPRYNTDGTLYISEV